MAASRSSARRRQRSVRVTVAVTFLGVATVGVLAALPTQSPLLLSLSSVLAVALGWAAARMMWTEVLQSRREQAADRAAAASAYKSLFAQRAAEHAEFTQAMTERLAEAHLERRELEGTVLATERRAMEAETRLARDSRRLVETQERIQELEQQLAVRRAEEADALASWEGEGGETIADLVAWDVDAAELTTSDDAFRRGA
jgi:methylmalonyl-CoA mutase cobalamin-binding subunit